MLAIDIWINFFLKKKSNEVVRSYLKNPKNEKKDSQIPFHNLKKFTSEEVGNKAPESYKSTFWSMLLWTGIYLNE